MNAADGLAGRALRALGWNFLGAVARVAATVVSQIALARLLGPEPLGLFAYALLTVTLAGVVVDMGLQAALVQAPSLDEATTATALGRLLLAATVATGAIFLLADAMAVHFFAAPDAAPVLRGMAPTLLVGAPLAVATALHTRELDLKSIQLARLASYLLGYLVVGVGAALAGLGVWALVLAWHVQTVAACLALVAHAPRRLRPGPPLRPLPMTRFGAVVMSTNILNWSIDSAPQAAVGRWLGAAALGQYSVARNLVKAPADHLVRTLQAVLFPVASRAQDDDAGLRRTYLTVLAGVGALSFPAFTFVAVTAHPLVQVVLGPDWAVAAPVLVPLSLAMVLYALEAMCGPILDGRGEPQVELRLKGVALVATLGVVALTVSWSMAALGWGVALVGALRWVLMHGAVMQRLAIAPGAFLAVMSGPLLLGAIAITVAGAVRMAPAAETASAPALLLVAATGTLSALVAVLVLLPRFVLGPHLLALLHTVFTARPALAARCGLRRIATAAGSAAHAAPSWPENAGR